ncbi:ROK family protein [Fredinandcohnia onubensis]|uniref:ROK family protein n=1 Tax=Fredinandcohnia onubensis TaxID=1571209 RepID=UPI000C0BBD55|nr:ROK family protein [Fredinandcohnia onubensis]
MKYAIGLDIGGTKIAAGIVNEKGDLIQKEILPSDPSDQERMFSQVKKCVEQLLNHSSIPIDQIYGIGAGIPGKVDRAKGVAVFQNNLPWSNFPFIRRIKESLKIENVVIDNDVYMAAFAEWKEANLNKDELFVYCTISTGIAISIIQGGEFIRGAGFAGELGLIPVYAPGEETPVMRLEETAAGPALEKRAKKVYADDSFTTKMIFDAYIAGDLTARKLINDMVTSLSHGIYMINSLLDPHLIVFGGSVASKNSFLLGLLKERLAEFVIDEQKHSLEDLKMSHLGNEQGIIGAGLRVFHP